MSESSNDELRYVEVTIAIAIDPPYLLHTVEGDWEPTAHGMLAQRIFDAVLAIAPDADMSAHIVTEADMQRRS